MRASLWVALGAGALLAAAHATAPVWSLAASVAAFAGLAVAARLASRRPESRVAAALAVLALCALAVLPGGLGQGAGPLAWALGLAAAVGVLAIGAPAGRLATGTLGRHPAWLVSAALLLGAIIVAPFLIRQASDPRLRLGAEWSSPFGLLVAGLAILLPFVVASLVAQALRRRPDDGSEEEAAAVAPLSSGVPVPQAVEAFEADGGAP